MTSLGRLVKLLSPFRGWIALAVLLSFATIGSSVGLMAVSAYLISKAALSPQMSDLSLAITGVRFFAIARAGLRYGERYVSHATTFRILTRLRVWFYSALEPLAPARLETLRDGDLLTRISSDIETLESFFLRVVVPPFSAALVTLFACLVLGAFDAWLGLALLFFLLLTGVALPWLTHHLGRQPAGDLVALRAELAADMVDQIQGMADLLIYDEGTRMEKKLSALEAVTARERQKLAHIRGLGNGLAALFTGLAAVTVLIIAIPLVTGGAIEGVYLALLPLTAIASFEAVQPLALALQMLDANRAAADRLFQLIDAKPAVVDPIVADPIVADTGCKRISAEKMGLRITDLRFRYGPDQPWILDGLSVSLPPGGRMLLTGPSGVGKSTLVNLLLRFYEYQEGEIYLGEQEIRGCPGDDVRRRIGLVSQRDHFFNTSIRDNLLLANPDAGEAALEAACRAAQIHTTIAAWPDGYNTLVGDNGVRLSGGQRQRLAIARAILKDPRILLLDEATSALDSESEELVQDALDRLMQGRTSVIIAHRLSTIKIAHR
ncbi:MAG: thiol reductant ABC exporter subunit CydC, partial [Caldilineaceae bacterium]|nr:thiol reductant ABC exporter subunit CydC [Caldilineaceae bacterium]